MFIIFFSLLYPHSPFTEWFWLNLAYWTHNDFIQILVMYSVIIVLAAGCTFITVYYINKIKKIYNGLFKKHL